MVSVDALSQDADALAALSEHYEIPVLSVHAPTLLLTQRVWGTDPWGKIDKSREVAARARRPTVVVHPPFRWQRAYARDFVDGVATRNDDGGPVVSVENMFPWRAGSREMLMYAPSWDPRDADYSAVTLDLSHTAVSGLGRARDGRGPRRPRLSHVHLADGTGSPRDEHLVPGRGNQPCAELLDWLARRWFTGTVVVEVSTRGTTDRDEQESRPGRGARVRPAQPRRAGRALRRAVTARDRVVNAAGTTGRARGRPAGRQRRQGEDPRRGPCGVRRARVRRRDDPPDRRRRGGRPGAGPPLLRQQGAAVRRGRAVPGLAGARSSRPCSPTARPPRRADRPYVPRARRQPGDARRADRDGPRRR